MNKKTFLSLCAAAVALCASAQTPFEMSAPTGYTQPRMILSEETSAPAADAYVRPELTATNSFTFGYCGEPDNGLQARGKYLGGAIQLDNNALTLLKGTKVVGLRIASGGTQRQAAKLAMAVWARESLSGSNLVEVSGIMDLVATAYQWVDYKFETPVEIDGTKKLYFGFNMKAKNNSSGYDYPLVADNIEHKGGEPGGLYGIGDALTDMSWYDYTADFGFLCIKLLVESDIELPQDMGNIVALSTPESVAPGVEFTTTATFANQGGNDVTSASLEVTFTGQEPIVIGGNFSSPISVGGSAAIAFKGKFPELNADAAVTAKVVKVNGADFDGTPITVKVPVIKGFYRVTVMEEGTGSWCGFCVRGIVGMEYMREKYGKSKFIGLAVHSGDNMQSTSYGDVLSYFTGFPSAIANRNTKWLNGASGEEFEAAYTHFSALPAVAKIDIVSVTEDATAKTAEITTKTTFAVNDNSGNYRIALVAVEDEVGPYAQSNYYAGGGYGPMGGFENEPSSVQVIYNDVVRASNACTGKEGSLPATVEEDGEYTSTDKVSISSVRKLENVWYAALLIDTKTGEIVNAAAIAGNSNVAIEEVETEVSEAPVRYFNLQGQQVENPAKGQVIVRTRGDKAEKIIF